MLGSRLHGDDEREGIRLAVHSAFRKLKNLYAKIVPHFDEYGFKPPSAGVVARDLSEKIETSIIQHCESFSKGAAIATSAGSRPTGRSRFARTLG